jgi:hypothetical protein
MADFRIVFKRGSLGPVLKSGEMRAAISEIAEGMAARARGMTDDDIEVKVHDRRDRVGAYINRLGSGGRGEALDRALGRSIGGA